MKSIQDLREKRSAIAAKLHKLMDDNPGMKWGPDQQAVYDKECAEMETIQAEILRYEKVLDAEASAPHVKVTLDEGDRPFQSFGDQLKAIAKASVPGGNIDKRLLGVNASAGAGAVEATGAEGGFLVQTDFATELMNNTFNNGVVMSKVRKRTLSSGANSIELNVGFDESNRANSTRHGGVIVGRSAELANTAASAPKWRKLRFVLNDMTGLFYASDDLLEDAAMLEAEVSGAFMEEFDFKYQDELINGDGAGKFLGILNSPALVTVDAESGQTAATLVFKNILKMYARMWAGSWQNATWYVNQDITPELLNLTIDVGTGGIPVYIPPNGLSAAPFGTLLGRPIQPIEQAATLGTVGDIILADFAQYMVVNKGGTRAASSIHLKFDYNQTTFRWKMRNDGMPLWTSPLTPYKGTSNTQSPFVVLATRS
jgi:HK97 family phage major capsid protein